MHRFQIYAVFLHQCHRLGIVSPLIPCNGADVEKISGIFAQKVGDRDATHIIIDEKMLHARRCIVRQML